MASISCFSTIIVLFAIICLAQSVTLHAGLNNALSYGADTKVVSARHSSRASFAEDKEDVTLLDVVLVASVDGRFHALNRTSGQKLWSMSHPAHEAPSSLAPLVRTKHATYDSDLTDDDDAHNEVYIIEPQSGDIYVMATPSSKLQRLSFSMAQLVEMSPFKFARDDDERVFVGKKETSLLSIELETGKVKAINAECPWDPFENFSHKEELDLDELEDYMPNKEKVIPTEVFIGRTDYQLSIFTRSNTPNGRKVPIQNLSFSTYGPNNQDNVLQAAYRKTQDSTYIDSLPSGTIVSLKAHENDSTGPYSLQKAQFMWTNHFDSPIVAVFDVLSSAQKPDPFVLLQPRPDILRGSDVSSLDINTAYVGLVEETKSLYVMGVDHFPLTAFGDTEFNHKLIESVDGITRRRKLVELCERDPGNTRCLTGKHHLDSSLNNKQLPGVPGAMLPPGDNLNQPIDVIEAIPTLSDPRDNTSVTVPGWMPWSGTSSDAHTKVIGPASPISTIGSMLLATAFAAGFIFRSKLPRVRLQMAPATASVPSGKTDSDATTPPPHPDTPVTLAMEISPVPSKPAPVTINSGPALSPDDTPSHVLHPTTHFAELEQPDTPSMAVIDIGDAEDSDRENATPKKRPRRGRRGKKGKGTGVAVNGMGDDLDDRDANGHVPEVVVKDNPNTPSPTLVVPQTPQAATSSLVVSDTILGFGSHGTVVYQGSLQGRAVAVKRLLQDFVTLASREVDILQESDDHPNVIRYYYQEAHANFLYIALELCPASLADVIESPDQFREISNSFDPKRALRQIASGLRHLHSLKIVHRDIKPQNILISAPKKGASGRDGGRRMLISDFGLCKKLEVDQTSFLPTAHGAMAAGTVGWRAPEILRGEVKLDDSMSDDHSQSSRGSVSTAVNGSTSGKPTRLTKSVDIFALGCLFYYVLTNGLHPFGDRFEREVNILKNTKSLDGLKQFGEEGSEAVDLITKMLDPEAYNRPVTASCLLHPFFWDSGRRLNFLQDASDRFEIMCRDPRDQNLIILETGAFDVLGQDWHARLDKVFIENLGKYRKYDGKSVQDLLRALRNKKHHYQDLPDHVKRHLGPMPEGFLSYFTRRFPNLFMHVHGVISNTSLCHESMFRTYFELVD
ncbi:hypothetical protein DEU56DRAFT_915970 [Suillus clintonianus]|uniref:uncharacterized protein n=1 Tax=Suillus clintonianus TaxID=1904413 RepID=UPI001B87A253|nr:uncharacterized protein DEU56DRAFT_915970 [Suillus clintonianus]KAG2126579.1 hypothetical protein DEU56DRAFT_915970 [Suillus clintonianus]